MNLPEEFLSEMKERLGENFPAFLQSYERAPARGVRVNTLKIPRGEFLRIAPFPLEQIPWAENGFYTTAEKAGADAYHFAGLYYCQEPSAMLPAQLLGVSAGERVLDLCAAPGGKCTQLAAGLKGTGVLVANEYDYQRARILSENVERLGVANAAVVSASPAVLAQTCTEFFDKILVDAPCSGEGMFKKEEGAALHWSRENVRGCAARQSEILESAAKMLRGGGTLVYSTCTFSKEENEEQIERFLERHSEFSLKEMRYLFPHEVRGEGQFAAVLEKTDGGEGKHKPYPVKRSREAERAFWEFAKDFYLKKIPAGEITTLADGRMYLLPEGLPALAPAAVLRTGVELGVWNGKIFKPAHALATSTSGFARQVRLSREECTAYLRGEPLNVQIENGWCVVTVEGYPLGLGKAVNGTIKNHFPKPLRLRK